MMNKSDYLRNALVNHTLRGVVFTPPSSLYIALFNVTPTSAGGGTEVSGGAYARQGVAFTAASAGSSGNTLPINFPTPTADWGDIPGAALFDALTGGNMLYFGTLGTLRTVYTDDAIFFPAGYFSITET
jgi:hypothetical protein